MSEDCHAAWQPMQTAPKDGTRILGRSRHGEIYHIFWSLSEYEGGEDLWWNETADDEARPIWWMPALPDPPAEGTKP